MKNYIRRSPLALLPAVSLLVFIVFTLSEGFATAYTVVADLRVWPGSDSHVATGAEIARQQTVPCVFDNFVWFRDQEIVDEIRKDLPSFDGSAPEAGDSIDKILGALKRMLKKKKLPSEVEYTFFSGDGNRSEHIFSARDA